MSRYIGIEFTLTELSLDILTVFEYFRLGVTLRGERTGEYFVKVYR